MMDELERKFAEGRVKLAWEPPQEFKVRLEQFHKTPEVYGMLEIYARDNDVSVQSILEPPAEEVAVRTNELGIADFEKLKALVRDHDSLSVRTIIRDEQEFTDV